MMQKSYDGSIILYTKHPIGSQTWHWSVSLKHNAINLDSKLPYYRDERRRGQWHNYYRLPFNWWIIVSQQDYHLEGQP